jgi:ABC-type transport system involved in multi-copper enzyme maturation permease subunit
MLPIVQRELRVASRSPKLYLRRVFWGFLQVVAIVAALLASGGGFRTTAAESFFVTFSRLALVLCLLEGVRKGSDAISLEKREGTLGFLFLSTLSGPDVILGKLAGGLTRSLSVLLPFLPVLALSLIVGGTTLGEFWRVSLVLPSVLILAQAVCLLISTLSKERSVTASIVVLAALCLMPQLPLFSASDVQLLSPFALLERARDLQFSRSPREYWIGLLIGWATATLSLLTAALIVPRSWQEPKVVKGTRRKAALRTRKRKFLEENPVLWLVYDLRGQRWFDVLAVFLALAGLLPLIALTLQVGDSELWAVFPSLAAGVLLLVIWMRVAVQSSSSVADAKADGSLEMLLATPLSVEDVLRGLWLAVWHSLRVPAFCAFALMIGAFLASGGNSIGKAIWTSKLTIELLLEAVVLAAVGMWMGLKAKNRAAAVVYTILLGGILPWIVCLFTILIQIVLLVRGLEQVKSNLRRIRNGGVERLLPPVYSRSVVQSTLPPVIR